MAAEVVGVGNAIVDVIGRVDDDFIDEWGLNKSAMTLIDEDRATLLTSLLPDGLKESGGSAANTMVGIASFGGVPAYIGKVRDDELGRLFVSDIRAAGVQFDVEAATTGAGTGRCLIQVTPDGQRTMNTFLGASSVLTVDDIDEGLIAGAKLLYCEGYLWDLDEAKLAIRHAMAIAVENGVTASLTLSDSFAVDRHRVEWLDLIADSVDLLFGNIHEVCALVGAADMEVPAAQLRELTETTFVTLGAKGSVVVTPAETITIPTVDVAERVDTTGAGDLYSAGVLAGLARGADLESAGAMGSCAASEIITHIGARPLVDLSQQCLSNA